MRISVRTLSLTLALSLAACGGSPTATTGTNEAMAKKSAISGKARLKNLLSHSGIIVTALGPSTGAAAVADDGSFTIEGLAAGTYAVTAGAPSTLEGTVQVAVVVKDNETATAPDLSLTPTGSIDGKASYTPDQGDNGGIQITADGASAVAFTGKDGSYHLADVPVGHHTVYASKAGWNYGSSSVDVQWNKSGGAPVVLLTPGTTEGGPGGTISGVVHFFNKTDHKDIEVSIEGSTTTAKTDSDGNYTLRNVPQGYVTLVAKATPYQPTRLENLLSLGSGNYRAPEMKLYLGQQRFSGTVTSGTLKTSPDGRFVLFFGIPTGSPSGSTASLYLVDTSKVSTPKLVDGRYQSSMPVQFSPDSKFATYVISGQLFLLPLESGSPLRIADTVSTSDPVLFASDSQSLVYLGTPEMGATGTTTRPLMLLSLANQTTNRVDESVKTSLTYSMTCGNGMGSSAPVRFSPDGKTLAFMGFNVNGVPTMKLFHVGGTDAVELSGDASCINFSADSRHLLWFVKNGTYVTEAWTNDASDKPVKVATVTSSSSYTSQMTASTDGQFIFTWVTASSGGGYDYTAWPVNGGSSSVFLPHANIGKYAPVGSAVFAYETGVYPSYNYKYYVVDPAKPGQTLSLYSGTSSNTYVTSYGYFSPAGNFFYFPDRNPTTYTYGMSIGNVATGKVVSAGALYSYYGTNVWAPSESAFTFVNSTSELHIADPVTGNTTKVVGSASSSYVVPLAFTPTGTALVWRASDYTIHLFDTASKADRNLAVKAYSTTATALSADGSHVTLKDDKGDLYTALVSGGDPLLIDNAIDQVVAPDQSGKRLVYTITTSGRAGVYFATAP